MNPLEKIIAALKKKVAPAPKPAPTPQPVRQSFATQKQSIAPPIPMPAPAPQRQTVAQPRQVINTKVTKVAAKPNIIQKGISNLKGNIKNFQDDDFKMYGPKVMGQQVTKLLSSKNKGPVKMQNDYLQDYVANAAGGLTEAGVASVTVPRSKKATTAEKAGAFVGGVGAVTAPVQSVQIGTLTSAFKKALNRDKPVDLEGDIAAGTKTAGVLKATGPIMNKVLGGVSSRLPQNPIAKVGGSKAASSILNVAEGVVIDKAQGMPTTPTSVAIDAVTGVAGGPNIRAGKILEKSDVAASTSKAVAKKLSEKDRLVSEAYSTVKNSLDTLNKPVKSIDDQLVRDNAERVIRDTHQSIFKVPKKTQGEVSIQDMVDDIYHAYDTKVIPKLDSIPGVKMGIYGGEQATGYKDALNKFSSLADKKPRFEIDDSGAKFNFESSFDLNEIRKSKGNMVKVSDLVRHDELFKQYPWAKDIKVNIDSKYDGASFNPKTNVINFNPKLLGSENKPLESTLLHEIQHAIQEREGFARGGSPDQFNTIKEVQSDLFPLQEKLRQTKTDIEKAIDLGYGKNVINELRKTERQLADKISALNKQLNNYVDPATSYKRLSGEVEARDVQSRIDLSPEQRLATQPYASQNVPVKDQIVRFDRGVSESTDPLTQEARKYKSAEEFVRAKTNAYHATTKDFTQFDVNKAVTDQGGAKAVFFSETPDGTKYYQRGNSKVMEASISPEARVFDYKTNSDVIDKYVNQLSGYNQSQKESVTRLLKSGDWGKIESKDFQSFLKKNGFDGFRVKDMTGHEAIGITNLDKLKTKSQLTDIYNQAKGGETYYHGTSQKRADIIRNEGFSINPQQKKSSLGKGVYLSSEKGYSDLFSQGLDSGVKGGVTLETKLKPNLKIFNADDPVEFFKHVKPGDSPEVISRKFSEMGYDGIKRDIETVIFDPKNIYNQVTKATREIPDVRPDSMFGVNPTGNKVPSPKINPFGDDPTFEKSLANQATKQEAPKGPMMGFSSIKDSGTGISQMARETANQSAKDAGVAPIDSRQANYTPLKESLINKNPTLRSTPEWGAEKSRLRNPKTAQNVASLSDTIVRSKDIDVKSKVNLVDYLRTPDRVLTKMGLAPEAKLIRQKYDDYLADLPKEIDKITAWSKQVSPESNRRIFQHLDGQKVQLDAKEAKVAGEVQTYLKEWADKLGLPEDGRIASYITHIFEKDFIQKEFDPELASLIRDKIPGSVYDPFLQERLGKQGYIEDTWRALDAYVKRATRKFHMDPALEKVSAKAEALEESQFSYVKSYVDRINMRPTKLDNLMDNTVKSVIGYKLGARPVAYVSRLMRQAVFRGALGLNVGSALKNLTQGANTYAKLGEKYTAVGYTNLVKSVLNGSKELEEVGILRDNFIQDRALSATKQTLQKVDKVLFALFETAERINRGSAYFGAKAKGLSEGMNEKEAIEYARNIVRDTQFTFGSVDTPILLQSDIGKTVAQFQSFTLKQTEFLAELAKNKDYAGLLRYTAGSLAMVYSVGQLFGMEPKDMIPAFRVGIPPTLKTPVAIAQAVMGTPDQYGNVPDTKERIENVGASMTTLIPGGVQLKKTLEGAGTVKQGYDTTKSGLVKYPVEQTPENYVRGGLFGKYNLPESKGYEKSGYLREADSEAIKQLPPEKREAFYKDQLDERAMDKVIKEKNEQKKAAIDAYLDGDETKAAALQTKHGITVKQEDIKRRQTEYKNKAIDAYLDGAEDTAASIQGKYGLDVKQADIQKRAKSRAITLYKRYLLTKNPKYEKQAADLQGTYGFQVKKEEIE